MPTPPPPTGRSPPTRWPRSASWFHDRGTMYDLLKGLRVVEGSAVVAAPTCGLYLAQYGAEVIRFDNIGGGPDFNRWPLHDNGKSIYWEGLNKAKKSIAI